MALEFSKWGLKAVAVNSSTITDGLVKKFKRGEYQVVISSPEAYKDANKLRGALLSEELANIRHITIVNEAHTIRTWGDSGSRKELIRTQLFVVLTLVKGVDLPKPTTVLRSVWVLEILQAQHSTRFGPSAWA
ncbi:hypothetical protein FRC09_005016 [Ceratobasidium sp. 395]|nr:hypothetical protein FRC09_005016 [Ceratobasidium sp. 395]